MKAQASRIAKAARALSGWRDAAARLGGATTTSVVEITKFSPDENLVFGYGLVAQNKHGEFFADVQGDVVEELQLESAVYKFMENYAASGLMHEGDEPVGKVVESFVLTKSKAVALGLAEESDNIAARWWIGVRVHDDEVMKGVRDGKYRAFSIQGTGQRIPIPENGD